MAGRLTIFRFVFTFGGLALITGFLISCRAEQATLVPTATVHPTVSATSTPITVPTATPTVTSPLEGCEGLFCRTEAAQRALLEEYHGEEEPIIVLDAALREEITAYLNAHLDPTRPLSDETDALDALRAALPNAGEDCTILPADLDDNKSDELLVWNCANMPVGLLFTVGEEGYTARSLPVSETAMWAWPQLWFGSLEVQDVTGDGHPELLLSYILPGGSMMTEKVHVLAWDGHAFQTRFSADLIDWVGRSTMELEPSPAGGQDIVLRYPHLYDTGFDAKMIGHPWAMQRWQWDPSLERYTLRETKRDLESVLDYDYEGVEWDFLGVLVNEAELHYQAGELEEALTGYQDVVARVANIERPEGRAANWPAYAHFRAVQVQALLGQADVARAELSALLADLDEESNLRPLVQTFDEVYDPAQPDAALRAMAALHRLHLYEQFYWHDDRPGDLTFPMNMWTLLWPGTPLACYLDAHPEVVESTPAQEQALLRALSELGFPVAEVRIVDLNADGLLEVLVTTDETDQPNGRRSIWLLAQVGGRWRSCRQPNVDFGLSEEVTEEPLPDGRVVLRERGLTFVWTGEELLEVDPETHEPLPPPWPRVGGF